MNRLLHLGTMILFAGAATAQEQCTRELIIQRDAELPLVTKLPEASNFVSSLEQLYGCTFDVEDVFASAERSDKFIFNGEASGTVQWYSRSENADGGAYAVVDFDGTNDIGRVAFEVADLVRIDGDSISISVGDESEQISLDYLKRRSIAATALQDNEAYPGGYFPTIDFSSDTLLLPGIDFDDDKIIIPEVSSTTVGLDFSWAISWMMPPRKTSLYIESIPSLAAVVHKGETITTTNDDLWIVRDAIAELEVHLDSFQVCDSNSHIINQSRIPPYTRLTCILETLP